MSPGAFGVGAEVEFAGYLIDFHEPRVRGVISRVHLPYYDVVVGSKKTGGEWTLLPENLTLVAPVPPAGGGEDEKSLPLFQGVDPQVVLAAAQASDVHKRQPEWFWYDHDSGCRAFGRWSRQHKQAAYVRLDIALETISALSRRSSSSQATRDEVIEECALVAERLASEWHDDREIQCFMQAGAAIRALRNDRKEGQPATADGDCPMCDGQDLDCPVCAAAAGRAADRKETDTAAESDNA